MLYIHAYKSYVLSVHAHSVCSAIAVTCVMWCDDGVHVACRGYSRRKWLAPHPWA